MDIIAHGTTGLVVRRQDYPNQALKCAYAHTVHEVEFERSVLEHIGPHRHIIKHFNTPDKGRLSLEYYPFDVRGYIQNNNPILLKRWAVQLADALIFIHKKGVIHRDLSPRNMLTSGWNLVLCDFAAASMNGKCMANITAENGFYHHCHDRAEIQRDIFAVGSVLYELSTGEPPYSGLTPGDITYRYRAGIFPATDHLLLGKVITNCWVGGYDSAEQLQADLPRPSKIDVILDALYLAISFAVGSAIRWLS